MAPSVPGEARQAIGQICYQIMRRKQIVTTFWLPPIFRSRPSCSRRASGDSWHPSKGTDCSVVAQARERQAVHRAYSVVEDYERGEVVREEQQGKPGDPSTFTNAHCSSSFSSMTRVVPRGRGFQLSLHRHTFESTRPTDRNDKRMLTAAPAAWQGACSGCVTIV